MEHWRFWRISVCFFAFALLLYMWHIFFILSRNRVHRMELVGLLHLAAFRISQTCSTVFDHEIPPARCSNYGS
jgi:hypothetical protein